ncbi:MAG TPA: SpoIID/LytB domain-containing protein [Candidatus Angelobacter sp.]|nr:SpoIID/LytB domain-containing protein [Candidatus Angelobacter sp.]
MIKAGLYIFVLISALSAYARDVQVGVLGLFHPREMIIQAEPGQVLECGNSSLPQTAKHSWQLQFVRSQIRVTAGDRAAFATSLICDNGHGGNTEFRVVIPGRISRRYRGKLTVNPAGHELLVIVSMEVETAVASVVAAESPPGTHIEALKAQAVAARSFLIAGGTRHLNFDFCDTTHCQFLREPPYTGSPAWQAALSTRGLVLTYHDRVFAALYSASCGGHTYTLEELGLPVRDYPYFSVDCEWCHLHPEKWATHISEAESQRLQFGELSRLRLARKLGWKAIPGNTYFQHPEQGGVLIEGIGNGHGLGMCQRGAADMAKKSSSFIVILKYYYPETVLRSL